MKEKVIVVYSEDANSTLMLEWMERQVNTEIVAINFSNDDAFLLSNTAMIVGAKRVYMIDLVSAIEPSQTLEELVTSKVLKIAAKENASSIVATDDTYQWLMKQNPSIKIMPLVS
ncbi:hypothetical protein [Fusibacter ferrireducens]|uniref:Uncharacterized protein n=1 Tax=Fusibacter ferrireducens TaxID=2785058 RepID=A0ABS0A220_9FIRM|nr:hypothetical protein [Fusibacter ferrireducens]MBF4695884.1 hypothetical protein [Fusibacter ferrireducens]